MPLKPDKFAIRFYAVVGWRSLYIHALWDNGSGNTTATTPAERYTRLFPRLRQPLYNVLNQGEVHVDPKTPSALWLAMIAHQTLLLPAENGRRLLVSDNFYTRHTLAKAVLAITDGETRMLGTVRQDWIGV
ncbi:Ankyrin repeat domain-containing protein 13A [Phytophthora nicotianae]|uniref:Ankyrin repeat domain-containing protein 13A n=1 Tax=Phytophthora nicotianae TaxID=4792 RepID=A0A0W8D7U4_PHYNI|nr:Ankyrin repeat domain-containing protein 13A [Phytophthora nicotianae]